MRAKTQSDGNASLNDTASAAEQANDAPPVRKNVIVDCGWGRLLFGQTFESPEALCEAIRSEAPHRRDIAFYVSDPHVVLASAPQELFLDPSHTYRLDLETYNPEPPPTSGIMIRRLTSQSDAEQVNRIYIARNMVPVSPDFFWINRDSRAITVFVAEDIQSGELVGTVMGVDHIRAFNDPERGSSLWCLGVDPQARHPKIGELLVRRLADHSKGRGCAFMDLSVLHDNNQAIALYERFGFQRVPYFALKRKNTFNERLYTGPSPADQLNPYAGIIVNEALRRGVHVEILDIESGMFQLTYGGRFIQCRESLSSLTTGVAVSICDDKAVTRRFVQKHGVKVPSQIEVIAQKTELGDDALADVYSFVERHKSVVVKPAQGEQGRGVAVDLTTVDETREAIKAAQAHCSRVVVEEMVQGNDLRIIVIDYKVVAAAMRRPASIVGNGQHTVRTLIEKQSRRRAAATQGESTIPIDAETERCIGRAGYTLDDVLDDGVELNVRKTANLHTGGTIHDVTDVLHPTLAEAAINAAQAIEIPVVGIDLMVKGASRPEYAFIEANERPGLANHEPQPTAERFLDLLFPLSIPATARQTNKKISESRKKAT